MAFVAYRRLHRSTNGRAIALFASDPLGAGNTALIAALGGNAAVLGFYDRRKNVTVSAGTLVQVDDVRGASGFGPSLIGTGHAPTWNASAQTASNTANTMYLQTAASAKFDVSVPLTLITVQSVPTTSADFVCAVTDGSTNTRVLGVAGPSAGFIRMLKSGSSSVLSTVAGGAAVRLTMVPMSSSAYGIAVANTALVHTLASGLGAAGNNVLTVFGSNAASTDTGSVWCATLVVAGDLGVGTGTAYTAAMTATATWAAANHNAVMA